MVSHHRNRNFGNSLLLVKRDNSLALIYEHCKILKFLESFFLDLLLFGTSRALIQVNIFFVCVSSHFFSSEAIFPPTATLNALSKVILLSDSFHLHCKQKIIHFPMSSKDSRLRLCSQKQSNHTIRIEFWTNNNLNCHRNLIKYAFDFNLKDILAWIWLVFVKYGSILKSRGVGSRPEPKGNYRFNLSSFD